MAFSAWVVLDVAGMLSWLLEAVARLEEGNSCEEGRSGFLRYLEWWCGCGLCGHATFLRIVLCFQSWSQELVRCLVSVTSRLCWLEAMMWNVVHRAQCSSLLFNKVEI